MKIVISNFSPISFLFSCIYWNLWNFQNSTSPAGTCQRDFPAILGLLPGAHPRSMKKELFPSTVLPLFTTVDRDLNHDPHFFSRKLLVIPNLNCSSTSTILYNDVSPSSTYISLYCKISPDNLQKARNLQ